MQTTNVVCDFCEKEIQDIQKAREVTVGIKDRAYPVSTLKYDLCLACYLDGPNYRSTFKKIWAKVTGRPAPTSKVTSGGKHD